nr:MAG TPA: hypothetical protein [Caudoviricetes sp.]
MPLVLSSALVKPSRDGALFRRSMTLILSSSLVELFQKMGCRFGTPCL